MDDGAARRARPRRAGRRRLGELDLAPLPAPAGRRGRAADRRGVATRPDGRGAHPSGGRDERRRARRPRGRRGRRDDDRRRARPAGLLPLPAILGRRTRRDAFTRGRVAPPLPGRAARGGRVGGLRDRGAAAAHSAARAEHPAARAVRRGAPLDVLRTAVSVLGAELGWRPTHDIGADELADQALGRCARSCRRSWRRRTGSGRASSRWSPGPTSASPPTTSTC